VRARLQLATLLLTAAFPAAAQRPTLEVSVLAASPPMGVRVSATHLLGDSRTRELLSHGFPTALQFRLELWRVGGLFHEMESSTQWNVLVRYDPYTRQYFIVQRQGERETESLGPYASLAAVEAELSRPRPRALPPQRAGSRYYYNLILDIETLSVSDLDELQRWLNGELRPAVRGKRAPLSALRRGIGTLLSRVLGGEKRHYEARSATFRAGEEGRGNGGG
jgi:hypothetical protein